MMMDPRGRPVVRTVDADGGNKDFARKLDELMGMQALSIGAKGIIGVDVRRPSQVMPRAGENHLKRRCRCSTRPGGRVISRSASPTTPWALPGRARRRGAGRRQRRGPGTDQARAGRKPAALPTTRYKASSNPKTGTAGNERRERGQRPVSDAGRGQDLPPCAGASVASRRGGDRMRTRASRLCGRRLGRNASPAEPFSII